MANGRKQVIRTDRQNIVLAPSSPEVSTSYDAEGRHLRGVQFGPIIYLKYFLATEGFSSSFPSFVLAITSCLEWCRGESYGYVQNDGNESKTRSTRPFTE